MKIIATKKDIIKACKDVLDKYKNTPINEDVATMHCSLCAYTDSIKDWDCERCPNSIFIRYRDGDITAGCTQRIFDRGISFMTTDDEYLKARIDFWTKVIEYLETLDESIFNNQAQTNPEFKYLKEIDKKIKDNLNNDVYK